MLAEQLCTLVGQDRHMCCSSTQRDHHSGNNGLVTISRTHLGLEQFSISAAMNYEEVALSLNLGSCKWNGFFQKASLLVLSQKIGTTGADDDGGGQSTMPEPNLSCILRGRGTYRT